MQALSQLSYSPIVPAGWGVRVGGFGPGPVTGQRFGEADETAASTGVLGGEEAQCKRLGRHAVRELVHRFGERRFLAKTGTPLKDRPEG